MMLDWQQVLPIETFPQITFPEDSFEGRLAGRREDGSELQRGFRIMFRYFELLALLSWRQKYITWNLSLRTGSFFVGDRCSVDMPEF